MRTTPDGRGQISILAADQLMKDDKGNSVAEISLFELPAGGPAEAGATVATPLETLLTEQLTLSVDGGTAKRYPFSYCSTKGCFARIGLTSEDVALLKRGKTASLTIVPVAAPNKKVALTMSLKGFTKGYEAVRANNEAIAAK
jgi:invasion protein IalB